MINGRTRGRPRSDQARRAVLDTALRLCAEHGYQQLTIKGIATEAGVGRQTVYRWWQDKTEVLMEALIDLAARLLPEAMADTGNTLRNVERLLELTFTMTRTHTGGPLVGLMSDAQSNPDLSERLQDTVLGPRRAGLRDILRRGVDRGELSEAVPLDLVVDFAFGAMWYRMLSRHAPVDRRLARQVTEAVGRMLAVAG